MSNFNFFLLFERVPLLTQRVGLLRVPLCYSNPLPAHFSQPKAVPSPSHPSRYLKTLVLLIFCYSFLFSQNSTPFFQLFRNQFFAYPYSGFGHRFLFNQKIPLEKIYFHTQTPFSLALNQNSPFNTWIMFTCNLKMYNEDNFPVKTPDYKISTHLSYQWDTTFQSILSIQHHSNGQKDSLFFTNGNINLETGNFSVNCFQTSWIKKFNHKYLKIINLHTEHLFFYFSMGYMKNFYYHHAFHLQTLLKGLVSPKILVYHHLNIGLFFQPHHKIRNKVEYITQLQHKNYNFLPFCRIYYGPDEYNSRYLYQNFQISIGFSSMIKPVVILQKYE